MKRKATILLALAALLAVGLIAGAAIVFGQEGSGSSGSANLPLRTAADAKPLQATMMGDVKVFTLTAEPILWQYENGKFIEAWAYNGQVPGPEIRVKQGDRVRILPQAGH